jgi:3-phenylpropionate/trans-cinnamate dioxygenase ferredoxin component
MSKTVELCKFDQLEDEGLRAFSVEGENVLLARVGDKVFAVENRCSHEDYPLEDGWIDEGRVCCSMHGGQFDPQSGKALTLPAYENIKTYPVTVVDGTIKVEIN